MDVPVSAVLLAAVAVAVSVVGLAVALNYIYPMLAGLTSVDFPSGPTTSAALVQNNGRTYLFIVASKDTTVRVYVACDTGTVTEDLTIKGGDLAIKTYTGTCDVMIEDHGVTYRP